LHAAKVAHATFAKWCATFATEDRDFGFRAKVARVYFAPMDLVIFVNRVNFFSRVSKKVTPGGPPGNWQSKIT
jgi:hypothetical protein